MARKIIAAGLLIGTLLSASGCSYIMSASPGDTAHTGEAWYVKGSYLPFIIPIALGESIYYCNGQGNTCVEAQIQ